MNEPSLRRQSIVRAQAGDAAAFEEILDAHEAAVLRTAQRLLLNDADAADAAQEVFVRLHKKIARFDAEREILPWLYRVTVNICHDFQRKRRKAPALSEISEPAAREADPEEVLQRVQRREILYEALSILTGRERDAIVLRHLEEFTTAEVAATLGSSEGTVRSQISMGLKKLRDHVARATGRKS